MAAQIKEKGSCIEVIFLYRDYHKKLAFLLSIFLLILGLPILIYGSPIFLILLSPLFLGLLWAIFGSKRLFILQNKIEISECIGKLAYQKKLLLTKELDNIHLHYDTVYDCMEGTDKVVFGGLVFTTKDGKQLKPFHYLDESESQRLQEHIKNLLNLTASSNCPCRKLKESYSQPIRSK